MTARMIVVYREPRDPAAFNAHYFGVHIPLAKQLRGLRSYEVSQGPIMSPTGTPAYLIGTLVFDSLAVLREAFASEIGKACAADRRILAPEEGQVEMFIFESVES
ncbi:MAG: EthD family reductase [Gemmatimonadaceae bacterium]